MPLDVKPAPYAPPQLAPQKVPPLVQARQQQPTSPRQIDKVEVPTSSPVPADTGVEEVKTAESSPDLAIFAKKERALRRQLQEFQAKQDAELKSREEKYQMNLKSDFIPKERLKSDLLTVLQEQGISYDEITQAVLNGPKSEDLELQKLRKRLEELEGKQTQTLTRMEEQQSQAYEQALNQIRNETKILVSSDTAFETIKDTGSEEAVVELIRETFDQTQQLLSVEEAAKQVEDYLIEEAFKMAQLRKVKERFNPAAVTAPEMEAKVASPSPQIRTLTHAQTASSKPMTARERAILAFQGQLKT